MRIITSGLVAAIGLLATSVMATDFGKVRLPGEATVKHDGDYVVYELQFESTCYTDEQQSITEVANNVASFVSWLENIVLDFSDGQVDYWANLISTGRDNNPYIYGNYRNDNPVDNPCYQKFSTTQSLSVRVTKADDVAAVTKALVQDFYNNIYQFLWPLNQISTTEPNAFTSAKISRVHKGIQDETLERMKEQAHATAAKVATARFLAVLGKAYSGQWFLSGADFTNERYVSSRHAELAAAEMGNEAAFATPAPSAPTAPATVINLEPLQYSIDGVFEFGFTRDFNDAAFNPAAKLSPKA